MLPQPVCCIGFRFTLRTQLTVVYKENIILFGDLIALRFFIDFFFKLWVISRFIARTMFFEKKKKPTIVKVQYETLILWAPSWYLIRFKTNIKILFVHLKRETWNLTRKIFNLEITKIIIKNRKNNTRIIVWTASSKETEWLDRSVL